MSQQTQFIWTGISPSGQKTTGELFANNKKDAQTLLLSEKITVLNIRKKQDTFGKIHFTHKNLLDFTQQLYLLLQAGVPLTDTLSLIATHSPNHITQQIVFKLREKIISGSSFANALHLSPEYFNETFCQMIAIGEQSGELEFVLSELINDQEIQATLRSKIAKVIFYHATILSITLLISLGLIIFVLPQFNSIYQSFGAQLPIMTTALIHLSMTMTHHAFTILFFLTSLMIIISFAFKNNPNIKKNISNWLFCIKPYRTLTITKHVAQWSRLMGMMLSTGIPLIEALAITSRIGSQPRLHQQMQKTLELVTSGKPLHIALNHCSFFPKRASYLISIGENADALDVMMKKISIIYQKKFEDALDYLSKLLEPVIMIIVASFVSSLIIAMYLPIFRMGNVI